MDQEERKTREAYAAWKSSVAAWKVDAIRKAAKAKAEEKARIKEKKGGIS